MSLLFYFDMFGYAETAYIQGDVVKLGAKPTSIKELVVMKSADNIDRISIGMSSSDVIDLMGNPQRINTTETSKGLDQQYVYVLSDFKSYYVYMFNGVVVGKQY